jgi:hypothetical protein
MAVTGAAVTDILQRLRGREGLEAVFAGEAWNRVLMHVEAIHRIVVEVRVAIVFGTRVGGHRLEERNKTRSK